MKKKTSYLISVNQHHEMFFLIYLKQIEPIVWGIFAPSLLPTVYLEAHCYPIVHQINRCTPKRD